MLQRALLGRQGSVGVLLLQLVLGLAHRLRGPRQDLLDGPEGGIGRHHAAVHAPHQRLHLLAQASLGEGQEDDVLLELLRVVLLPVPDQVEGGGDDLALRLGELARVGPAAHAAAPAALRRLHAVVLAVAADLDEVQVALDVGVLLQQVAVGRPRVVREEVTRLELQLLEEERVARRDLPERIPAAVEQAHRLFRSAVHRIDQVERVQAEVVVRARLDEHLLDGAGGGVAPRADEHRGRRLIGQHVDRVLRRGGHELARRRHQVDAVEALLLDREAGRQAAVFLHREIESLVVVVVENELSTRRAHGRDGAQTHLGALQHGDVAAVLHRPRLQPGVLGEVVLQLDALGVRQLDHVQPVGGRLDPDRLHEVVDRLLQIEQQHLELSRFDRAVLGQDRNQRQPIERVAAALHQQVDLLRLEADEAGGDRLIRSSRDRRVARQDLDLVRAGRLDVSHGGEQRIDAVPQIGGPEGEEQRRGGARSGQQARRAPELPRLDAAAHVDLANLLHRRLDEPAHQLRRVVGRPLALALPALLDRAQHRRLQLRRVLFDVERDTLVGDPARDRSDEEPPPEGEQRHVGHDAEHDDRSRIELEQLEAEGRRQQRPERRRHENGHAAQAQPQAPAVPDVTYRAEDFVSIAGQQWLVAHGSASIRHRVSQRDHTLLARPAPDAKPARRTGCTTRKRGIAVTGYRASADRPTPSARGLRPCPRRS